MEMPVSFKKVLEDMSTEDLKELRQWNATDGRTNQRANIMIDQEIKKREAK
jgi:hypothetical protein